MNYEFPFTRSLSVFADGEPVTGFGRARLTGKDTMGLYPSAYTLRLWNLPDPERKMLSAAGEISVRRGDAVLAAGQAADACSFDGPEGTVTEAVFSAGLRLWEAPVSLSVEAGVSVSETVLRILAASGTGIQLLSFPGDDPVFTRGQAFCGRAADCITEALSAASVRGYLVPAGLCVIPRDPPEATLHLTEKDLTDRPAYAGSGRKLILSTTVTGFQPGEEMTLAYGGKTSSGMILERLTDADTALGPWNTQLLTELHTANTGGQS